MGARDRDERCEACAAIVAAPRQLDGQQRRRFAQRAADRARAAHIGQRCRHHRHQRLAQVKRTPGDASWNALNRPGRML
jgi:hypothetical protein